MNHEEKVAELKRQYERVHGEVGLDKDTGNLFRRRTDGKEKLDVRAFNDVVSVEDGECVVEGMTTFEDLVDATLEHGYLPPVVPQLKTITIGGAISGIGIESSSHMYGLVHETVLEMEVLTGDGRVVTCSPEENSDLFYGVPNSYGTLGYVLKVRIPLIKAKPYVKLTHTRYTSPDEYFSAVKNACESGRYDYVDGTAFSTKEMYLTTGALVEDAPYTSSYTYMDIYYRSIKSVQKTHVDYLTAHDYIWRWDTDWFWCSKNLGAQIKPLRTLVPFWLNSRSYWKLMSINGKYRITDRLKKLAGNKARKEAVIQDVEIPVENASEFLTWFSEEIGITPVWACPIRPVDDTSWTLYPMEKRLYINFGFWDFVETEEEEGYYNRLVEEKVRALDGKKSLYSESYYGEDEFWTLYNGDAYEALKERYDPDGRLKTLYAKCVERA